MAPIWHVYLRIIPWNQLEHCEVWTSPFMGFLYWAIIFCCNIKIHINFLSLWLHCRKYQFLNYALQKYLTNTEIQLTINLRYTEIFPGRRELSTSHKISFNYSNIRLLFSRLEWLYCYHTGMHLSLSFPVLTWTFFWWYEEENVS